jgi:hypothetical protein
MKRETLIKEMKRVADEMQIERTYPSVGKPSTATLKIFGGRISAKLIEEFKKLPGARSHNLERAMRLWLMLHNCEESDQNDKGVRKE